MANQFVPLEEAAKLLGIPTEQLVTMRSDGEIRAFKDGTSWKFPQAEIDRLLAEREPNESADDSSAQLFGSDIEIEPLSDVSLDLGSDLSALSNLGDSDSGEQAVGSLGGSDQELFAPNSPSNDTNAPGSQPILAGDDSAAPSDEELSLGGDSASELDVLKIADSGGDLIGASQSDSDIDLSLDLGLAEDDPSDAIDIDLSLSEKALSDPSDIDLSAPEPAADASDLALGSDVISDLGSDLNLAGDSAVLAGSDSASPVSGSVISDDDDDDLVISDDDDLVLDSAGSDVSVAGGSGINLMSPSDSGLSLEGEPVDLGGSSISAIDLSSELSDPALGSGSGSGRGPGSSGSLVDFKADEEFQLSPGGIGLEADDDSASQVIEIEDSQSFGDAMELGGAEMLSGDGEAAGWDQADASLGDEVQDIDAAEAEEVSIDENAIVTGDAPVEAGAGAAAYEIPFSIWNVMSLAGILLMLSAGGIISADLMRNLWTDGTQAGDVSSLTSAILKAMGMDA
ncbi:Helix-turn-helix domain protein [Rosistilla ulvae]|uniref:Helix-turn-helix domain protein n=1 Tax=Rosistilla ulvae TaxID=1930277 RepID=A0A517M6Q3_9BACT|nr:helix-turn-helix domain-containing protein [Rosistilla ulvae]QDS90536.1 Helix-turn-helix domain protein [Rosistilla ulvae]